MPEKSRMRFTALHLDGEKGFRGGERQLLYLAEALREAGHGNIVVCREETPLQREAERRKFETLTLTFLCEWDPVTAWCVKRASDIHGAVVHAHTAHAAGIAALAERLGGRPWVAHRRVDFHLGGTLSRRLKYEAASGVIAVSKAIRDVMAEDGLDPGRVTVIPDAMPFGKGEALMLGMLEPWGPAADRAALRAKLGLEPGNIWIGNLAAMVPHKDQANLLRAAALIIKEEPRARFLIVGEGPLRGALERLADSLGVRSVVLFPGQQTDPRPWLQALDVYCQPSWGEGMGSVLLEAMACRVPIAATTAGGIPEVVEDGRSALLVPPRDPQVLARAVLAILRDPDGAAKRVDAAAASLERFSLKRMAADVLELYSRVVPEAGRV